MRKLATIRRIQQVNPIPNADNIEVARVDGWWVVVLKNQFQVGDLSIYFELDSWIPSTIAPHIHKDFKEYNGVPGSRLKTIRLRGQISQGLLLPISEDLRIDLSFNDIEPIEGLDLTDHLGIQKWEAPVSPTLRGNAMGNFPSFIPKTDQERIQNLRSHLDRWNNEQVKFEVTEKLDGTSFTAFIRDDDFGVCSRNLRLREDDNNLYWKTARKLDLEEKIRGLHRNISIQGEIIGEGVQKNRYQIKGHSLFVFGVYDIDAGIYLTPYDRHDIIRRIGLQSVPVVHSEWVMQHEISDILAMSEGMSGLNKVEREGFVFNRLDYHESFKSISNKFLLKYED